MQPALWVTKWENLWSGTQLKIADGEDLSDFIQELTWRNQSEEAL